MRILYDQNHDEKKRLIDPKRGAGDPCCRHPVNIFADQLGVHRLGHPLRFRDAQNASQLEAQASEAGLAIKGM